MGLPRVVSICSPGAARRPRTQLTLTVRSTPPFDRTVCFSNTLTGNQTLNSFEAEYIAQRRPIADAALKDWLSKNNLTSSVYGGDFGSVNSSSLPTISIALSGGGNRAALYGAGVLNAMDGRNATSVQKGTGGLLQATTYLSGLSGGSWLLSSYVLNNMPEICESFRFVPPRFARAERRNSRIELCPTPCSTHSFRRLITGLTTFVHRSTDSMVLGDGTNSSTLGWKLKNDLFAPGNTNQSASYVAGLFADMAEKSAAGFPVTINDAWARGEWPPTPFGDFRSMRFVR